MGTSNFVTKAVKHKRWQGNKATSRSTKIQRATYHTALQNITGNFQHKYGTIVHLKNMNVMQISSNFFMRQEPHGEQAPITMPQGPHNMSPCSSGLAKIKGVED